MVASAARKMRRVQGKKKQLQQKSAQLTDALTALSNVGGLQQVVEALESVGPHLQKLEDLAVETRTLVDALVEDYQTIENEREQEHRVLCRVLNRLNLDTAQSVEVVEALFDEEAAALQAEDT